jgi:hypothetical protein
MGHTQAVKEHGESTTDARWHASALGWEVPYSDDSYRMVEGNGIKIGFGKVEGSRPVQWPDEACAQRFYRDLQVDDLDEATDSLCAIGASQPDFQPGAGRWRVLLDPDGQPFCLSPPRAAVPWRPS